MGRSLSRRRFLVGASRGAAAAAVIPTVLAGQNALGANEKVRLGFIGTGGRGQHHIRNFLDSFAGEVAIVALSDVDDRNLNAAAGMVGGPVRKERDFRRILDAGDVDAVVIAPPDHWHAIPAVRACEAGKDVYVEKPLGHNVREGRLVADAMKRHGRVVAIGTQQRSGPHFIEAVRRIRAGDLGKVTLVHAWNAWDVNGMGGNLGNPPDGEAPSGVDYDFWLGPAPKRPFNPQRFHFSFYFHWDYSGGMVSAWGVHLFDVVAWALGQEILSVSATGGKLVHRDIRETPDTADASFECPGFVLTYTMRHGNGFPLYGDLDHGIDFCGTEATLRLNRRGFNVIPEGDRGKTEFVGDEGQDIPHKRNWLECLRSRKKPNSDAEDGHLSSVWGHLANIALRTGRKIRWDSKAEKILGDPEASSLLTREYRSPWTL